MFKNYLKIILRNLWKDRGYAMLNVLGLTLGLTCCLFIVLYVTDELSYDRFHANADRIMRISHRTMSEGTGEHTASTVIPFGPTLKADYPDLVDETVRFMQLRAPSFTLEYEVENKRFNEPDLYFTDAAIFDMFSFELLAGNPETALQEPNSIVLTEELARKYFGGESAIGKTLRFEDDVDFKVTGVMENLPSNTHFNFDCLVSFTSLHNLLDERLLTGWYWNPTWTYVMLRSDSPQDVQALETALAGMVEKYFPDMTRDYAELIPQSLPAIHLHSHLDNEMTANSDVAYVYIFSVVALLVLVIACINFINLATARSLQRSKEVSLRKTLGASRGQLIAQFMGEAFIMTLIAMILAVMVTSQTIPAFNSFANKTLTLDLWSSPSLWLWVVGILAVVSLLAGGYPALQLSSYQPVVAMKPVSQRGGSYRSRGREMLIVTQFTLSIALIFGSLVVNNQLHHLRNSQLGFDQEQVLIVPIARSELASISTYQDFRNRLLQHPKVLGVTAMEEPLGTASNTDTYRPEGIDEERMFARVFVHPGFVETFDIPIIAGRDYLETDYENANGLIINEKMVEHLGWGSPEEAIGKRMRDEERVVGVVKDFNFTSLHQDIQPFVLPMPDSDGLHAFMIKFMAVKVAPGDLQGTIAAIQNIWDQEVTDRVFEYTFLDESINALYESEASFEKVISLFSGLAILLACLGLFGLTAYAAERRTKEIGIRKVLGASVGNVVALLSRDFLLLILIAAAIALPIAWWGMNTWLSDFAYRIDIAWWVFALAGIGAMLVALVTVSFQAIRAAIANPVESLRSE